ncbi:MAG: radical SAM protein [Ignavibacteriaceae bacterium]
MIPSYLEKLTIKDLRKRADTLQQILANCKICPNECTVNRSEGDRGTYCHSTDEIKISSYAPHFGEEPPLVGFNGSGTIFFANCNLSCVFCQNYDISQLGHGKIISTEDLANIMLWLQIQGCHNINLVTPTHFVPQIVSALVIAVDKGLEIPIVYNCGGYESVETIKLLEDIVDIYMPDIKYSDNKTAAQLSGIKNYWDVVQAAVKEMYRQVGDLHINKRGIAKRGLLIRHLVLPNDFAGSQKVVDLIANDISRNTYINIMDQYYPAYMAEQFSGINRRITNDEFKRVIHYAEQKGLTRGF